MLAAVLEELLCLSLRERGFLILPVMAGPRVEVAVEAPCFLDYLPH